MWVTLPAWILGIFLIAVTMSIPWMIVSCVGVFGVGLSMRVAPRRILDRRARSLVYVTHVAYCSAISLGAVLSESEMLAHANRTGSKVEVAYWVSTVSRVLLLVVAVVGLVTVVWLAFYSPAATALRAIDRDRAGLADIRVYEDVMGGKSAPTLHRLARNVGSELMMARGRLALALVGAFAVGQALTYALTAMHVPIGVTLTVALLPIGLVIVTVAKHGRLSATEVRSVDRRSPMLIMRAFADDKLMVSGKGIDFPHTIAAADTYRLEQLLAHGLRSCGPSVTIGEPSESYPLPGAARQYATDATWRDAVQRLIADARCLVYVIADTEHLEWELKVGVERRGRDAVLLVIPPVPGAERRTRWRRFARFAERALEVEMGEFGARVPLIALVAGKDLVVIEGEDDSGRSYLVASRLATQLVAQPRRGVAELRTFLAEHLPGFTLSPGTF